MALVLDSGLWTPVAPWIELWALGVGRAKSQEPEIFDLGAPFSTSAFVFLKTKPRQPRHSN
jgi:hypothetical protein